MMFATASTQQVDVASGDAWEHITIGERITPTPVHHEVRVVDRDRRPAGSFARMTATRRRSRG
jgi:hypothetical protein